MATKTYFKWRVGRSIVILPSVFIPTKANPDGNEKITKLGKAAEKEYQNYLKRKKNGHR